MFSKPTVSNCLDILEFEKLTINKETNKMYVDAANMQLLLNYSEVTGWLEGFFSARNLFDTTTDGDVTKTTRPLQWMTWIYSYCRAHPNDTLAGAAFQFSNALSGNGNAK